MFIPFGSYLHGESRDQDFYYTCKEVPLVEGAIPYNPEKFILFEARAFLKGLGFEDPDIFVDTDMSWEVNPPYDMDTLIRANLLADFPSLEGHIKKPTEDELLWAMKCNVDRWNLLTPTIKRLRKRVFSQAQLEAYEKNRVFINRKSQVVSYLVDKKGWDKTLAQDAMFGDGASLEKILSTKPESAFRFKSGCYYCPPGYQWESDRCEFVVKSFDLDSVLVEVEETYTYSERVHQWRAPIQIWEKLVSLLFEEY